jgi:hypothetical protein
MRRSSKKLPTDPNQLAAEIVRLSTEESEASKSVSIPSAIAAYLSKIGRKGGLKGGKARMAKLSAERRVEIATKAAKARWTKSGFTNKRQK